MVGLSSLLLHTWTQAHNHTSILMLSCMYKMVHHTRAWNGWHHLRILTRDLTSDWSVAHHLSLSVLMVTLPKMWGIYSISSVKSRTKFQNSATHLAAATFELTSHLLLLCTVCCVSKSGKTSRSAGYTGRYTSMKIVRLLLNSWFLLYKTLNNNRQS